MIKKRKKKKKINIINENLQRTKGKSLLSVYLT